MKKLLWIMVMLLWSNTAQAEWTFVYTDIQDYYYDKETITKKAGGNTFFWLLQDITNPTSDSKEKGEKSVAKHTEVDCKLKRYKWIQIISYSEQMGKGNVMHSFSYNDEDWESAPPASDRYILFDKEIC